MRNDTITIEPDLYGRGDSLYFGRGNMGTSIVIDADDERALLELLQRRAAAAGHSCDNCLGVDPVPSRVAVRTAALLNGDQR